MKAKANAFFLCFFSILLILGLAGCAAGSTSLGTGDSETTAAVTKKSEDEKELDETVFPKDKIVDVKITIDADDFQNMMDNASAEEYKQASVEYNGQKFDNVAIRTKGNLSLNSVVNMPDSDRYSLKISFDEYVNQTISGISKINLNNNYSDASYMREFLSYELAEEMGLPTPKYSYVNVYVNDELWGFYLAVEQIGDAYLERNFGNSYGALYKANGGSGSELNWLETIDSYTGLDLKSDKSNDDILLSMLDELNNGTDYESVLDVNEALKFIALNAVGGNMDSYLSEKKHNYYLYEDDGIFSVLPWDYNMSFGGFGGGSILIDEPTSGTLADRPLVDKLLKVEDYKEQYHEIIRDMLEGYLEDETFQARVQQIQEMISPYVKADPSSFYTYEQYEQGITSVVSFTTTQTSKITQQLVGTIASSGDGSGSGGGMGGMGGGGMEGGMGGDRPARDQNMGQGEAPAQGEQTEANKAAALRVPTVQANANIAIPNAQGNGGAISIAQGDAGDAAPNTQGDAGTTAPIAQGDAGAAAPNAQGDAGATVPNAQGDAGAVVPNTQGDAGTAAPNAQGDAGAAAPNTQGDAGTAAPNAQGDAGAVVPNGQAMPDGQMPDQQGGFGGQGGMGGARPEGGFGGGMGGGMGGFGDPGMQNAQPQGSAKEASTTGIVIALLLLSCVFIVFYKRKRL